jgi:hypothetical protein
MPRAKKELKAALVPTPPVDEEGFYKVPTDLLLRWRAYSAEVREARTNLKLIEKEIEEEIQKQPRLKDLLSSKGSVASETSSKMGDLTRVQDEISKLFGINLRECSIDDLTGRLYYLGPNEPKTPLGPPRKRKKG